uniref:Solute carrier family 46 member 3 n=1 Tax=Pygocentrus nattereri TaxID=42514 RepID=A0AAR2JA00_PYGNA
ASIFFTFYDPVVGLHAFAMFMTYPLLQQYVYRRLWHQLSGYPYPSTIKSSQNSIFLYSEFQAVQTETSRFLLQSELIFLLPCLFSSLLLLSYSDYRGRKVAMVPPLVGDFLFTLSYFIVSWFSLSLGYLLAAAFLAGLLGGPNTLLGGCFSYVADRCQERPAGKKTVQMARLDAVLGVLSGLGSLCTGFFIRAAGFSWPFLTASMLHLLNLLYVLGAHFVAGRLQGVYLLFAASTRRRNTVLLLLLSAFIFYKVITKSGMSIFILFELNAPLCWNELLVGYGSALSTLIYLNSFAGVALLSRWLPDGHIALLGLLSIAGGLCMAAFAKTTPLMFLVRLPLLLSIMPAPVLRSMMSKLVPSSEQGAVFACVAFVEMLSMGLAFPVFSSIYAATISWFPGFSFLLAAGLALIPHISSAKLHCRAKNNLNFVLLMVSCSAVLWLRMDGEECSRLTTEDDTEGSTSSEILQLPQWHDC